MFRRLGVFCAFLLTIFSILSLLEDKSRSICIILNSVGRLAGDPLNTGNGMFTPAPVQGRRRWA